MVDTLVSGASASRHVGSSPISGTKILNLCNTGILFNGYRFFLIFAVSELI